MFVAYGINGPFYSLLVVEFIALEVL